MGNVTNYINYHRWIWNNNIALLPLEGLLLSIHLKTHYFVQIFAQNSPHPTNSPLPTPKPQINPKIICTPYDQKQICSQITQLLKEGFHWENVNLNPIFHYLLIFHSKYFFGIDLFLNPIILNIETKY